MTQTLLHWSKVWDLMQRKDAEGNPIGFQLKYVKLSTGEVREYPVCFFTSMHSRGGTVNVIQEGEFRPRKIRRCLIIEFNHCKIYL